jgi:DNA-damage-inducible protein D
MYGGLGPAQIKRRKRIPLKDQLLDRMNTTELAANQFRMTQTRDKLARDGIRDQRHAIQTHNQVGKEVRQAIQRIGGTLPGNIPPAEHIRHVQERLATTPPKLQLEDKDAKGLTGDEGEGKSAADAAPRDAPCN